MKPEFLAQAQTPDRIPKPSLPEIAFIGRSNVGKSSLINTLVEQKIARTSSTPGRTQGLIFFKVKPNLVFVDFPGFGYAKTSKTMREDWAKLAEHYYEHRRTLRATVWIYDIRRDPDDLDFQMNEWLISRKKPYLMVLTKSDQLKKQEGEKKKKQMLEELGLESASVLVCSSKTKEGIGFLWKRIGGL